MKISSRSRLIALGLILAGAGTVWVNAGDGQRFGARGVALLALAGGGALLATRGTVRRLVALTVMLAGLGLALAGNVVAIISGLLVVAGGTLAVVTCPAWPVMGARYERAVEPEGTDLWAALDRGEDPTATPQP
jgi:Tryptophan-associated transmembrane protein (Trp_oprn_chp)